MRSRLTKAQMQEIQDYVRDYKQRGVIGTFWYLAEALEVALKEISLHRRACRKKNG